VGLFHVTFGVGFFNGAIFANEIAKRLSWTHYVLVMGIAALTEGLFVSLFSQTDHFLLALTVLSFAYVGRSVVITLFNSISSRLIDGRFMGRYFALNKVFSYTAMGTTMLLCGWALNLFSARWIALSAGVFLLVNGMLWINGSYRFSKTIFEIPEFSK
jgi:predicted MFS family arabinose efflux permease